MEQGTVIANGDREIGTVVRAIQDTQDVYKASFMKTSQCLTIAIAALEYAISAMEKGPAGALLIARLEKDLRYIKGLMQ